MLRLHQILLVALCSTSSIADFTTSPKNTSFGIWQGWGTSLAWWAKAFGDRSDLADAFFTLLPSVSVNNNSFTVPGLGLNIVRYNAGASSTFPAGGTAMVRSPNVKDSRLVDAFWLTWEGGESSQWDWSRDANQRAALMKAVHRGADQVQLFSNSPVWWMCDNHNPSGSASGADSNLQEWNLRNHTKYLATIIAYFQKTYNVTFQSVDPFNEPNSNWWKASGTQEGCHFSPNTQATVLQYMREELDTLELTSVKIAASDENSYTLAIGTWNAFDSATKATVDQVNVHGYEYGNGRRDVLYNITQQKTLWNSEYAEGDDSGKSLATNLVLDLKWLHPTAWIYWQAVDGLTWGLLAGNEDTTPLPTLASTPNNKYFVLAQFSRHVRPGMVLIDGGNDKNTIAGWSDDKAKLILVTTNYAADAQTVTYDLSNIYNAKGIPCPKKAVRWATKFDGSQQYENMKDVNISSSSKEGKYCMMEVVIASNQIVTLEM
jgi:galactan endo-1,6-beta-galactosidase